MKLLQALLPCLICLPTAQSATLTIGYDVSGSSPVFVGTFAKSAGAEVEIRVAALSLGDKVIVKPFGARDLTNRAALLPITRSARPRAAAGIIARQIAAIPQSGIAPQGSTNIVAFLEFGEFDCANGGQVFLITDGLEASTYADPGALLKGKAKLPAPETPFLSGCAVTFYGLGARMSPQAAKTLRDAWRAWVEKAGGSFAAVIP